MDNNDLMKASKELHAAYAVLVRGDDKTEQRWYDAKNEHSALVGRIEAEEATVAVLSREELATVLAALAHYQATLQDVTFMRNADIEMIATDGGELEALMPFGVDALRERLNGGEG